MRFEGDSQKASTAFLNNSQIKPLDQESSNEISAEAEKLLYEEMRLEQPSFDYAEDLLSAGADKDLQKSSS